MRSILGLIAMMFSVALAAQTKVSGVVVDDQGEAIPYANVMFPNTTEGTITNEDGRFYLESDTTYPILSISMLGYTSQDIELEKKVSYDLKVVLSEGEVLDEVVVYVGKQPKKGNPAVAILRKIWEKKRQNGIHLFDRSEEHTSELQSRENL